MVVMEMTTLEPGERLKDRLLELDVSQYRLAGEVGVGQATVSRWISGERVPRPRYIPDMARVLGLPPDEVASWWSIKSVAGVQRMVERSQRGSGVSPRLRLKEAKLVPILGPVPADYPDWMSGLMEHGIWVSEGGLAGLGNPKFVVVEDNVLADRGLVEGSMVLVDLDRQPGRGNIVLVRVADRVLLREFFPDEGGYVLRTYANREQPIFVGPADDVELMGVAVAVHREESLV